MLLSNRLDKLSKCLPILGMYLADTESRSGSESGGAEQLTGGRNWFSFSHTGGQHCQNLGRSSLGLEYLGWGYQSAQTREVFLGPRGPLIEPLSVPSRPPVHPSATIFPEFIDEL